MMFLDFITNHCQQCKAIFKPISQVYFKTITCDMFYLIFSNSYLEQVLFPGNLPFAGSIGIFFNHSQNIWVKP